MTMQPPDPSSGGKSGHDLFLSYNAAQRSWVRRLASDLEQRHDIKCFFDEWDIRPGENIRVALREGLRASRRVALVISPQSMKSGWVELESSIATLDDPSNRSRRVIPIYRETCPQGALPEDFGILSYLDFRDDARYDGQLEDLVREIRNLPRARRYSASSGPTEGVPASSHSADETLSVRVEAMNLLLSVADAQKPPLAFELLASNSGQQPVWISKAHINSRYHYEDGCLYMYFSNTYHLSLRCQADVGCAGTDHVRGIIHERDQYGRHISGSVTHAPHYCGMQISFPLYLELKQNSKALLRFVVDDLKKKGEAKGKSHWEIALEEMKQQRKGKVVKAPSVATSKALDPKTLPIFEVTEDGSSTRIELPHDNTESASSILSSWLKDIPYRWFESQLMIALETDQGWRFGARLLGTSLGYV